MFELTNPSIPFHPQPHSRWELSRRQFVSGAAALLGAGLLPATAVEARQNRLVCCSGSDPLGCIRSHYFDTLTAFLEAQICCLFRGAAGDSAHHVALDALDFMRYVPRDFQEGLCGVLQWLNIYSTVHTGRKFSRLSPAERWTLVNQGESPTTTIRRRFRRKATPLMRFEEDFPMHSSIATLALLGRLVISSRRPAREYIGCTWSSPCRDPLNLVHIEAPAYPHLDVEYDVCIIGSGAGGALLAARAAEAGQRVLIIEAGKWVSPHTMVEHEPDAQGQMQLAPPRGDRVLKDLYLDAGLQLAGNVMDMLDERFKLLFPRHRRRIPPEQSILVLQAQVVGGGPYVNNAIHVELEESVWDRWPCQPTGVSYEAFFERMQEIKQQLGVNTVATRRGAGLRGLRFEEGANLAGDPAILTPVSIVKEGHSCGADNSVDPFGMHTGGLHPFRKDGPNSFMMRALEADLPAVIAYESRAVSIDFETRPSGEVVVGQLTIEDRRGLGPGCCGTRRTVRARQYALCAGAVASTKLLQTSLCAHGVTADGLGEGLNGNVGVPVFAVYDQPIYTGDGDLPEPGVTQCFYVREREVQDPDGSTHKEPVLENWFHFPGILSLAVNGWFQQFGEVMRKFNHIASAAMVVPTAVRPQNRVQPDGKIALEVDQSEFELLLRGILRIGQIFLAAATPENGVTLYLPTRAILLDACGRPIVIRNEDQLRAAIAAIACRGPTFMNLLSSHPQGGNALGKVVDPATFCVRLADGRQVANLRLADASIFPAGCELNPQLALKALASYAADSLLAEGGKG